MDFFSKTTFVISYRFQTIYNANTKTKHTNGVQINHRQY